MALRCQVQPPRVFVWTRSASSLEKIERYLPDCEATNDLATAVGPADLVVLCTPPETIAACGEALRPLLNPGAVVTDAGSVKAGIVARLHESLGPAFVGAHPMAGSERAGIEAAEAGLFRNSVCILTPVGETSPDALRIVTEFWQGVGCRTLEMSPEAHDRAVARISHLPHAAAAALVNAALAPDPTAIGLAGPGFRDTTRVAGGNETLWTEIFLQNQESLVEAIDSLQGELERFKTAIRTGDRHAVHELLGGARTLRDALRTKS